MAHYRRCPNCNSSIVSVMIAADGNVIDYDRGTKRVHVCPCQCVAATPAGDVSRDDVSDPGRPVIGGSPPPRAVHVSSVVQCRCPACLAMAVKRSP